MFPIRVYVDIIPICMSEKIVVKVAPRKILGKKSRFLRREGIVIGNISRFKVDSIPVQMNGREFSVLYERVGDTGVVYLEVEGDKGEKPALIDEIQRDPVTDDVLHVVFKEVDLSKKIKADVPIELLGEFGLSTAVMVQVKDSVEVEALPADLPEKFEVNIEGLEEVGQSITLQDLSFDNSKIELTLGEDGLEEPVVLVQEQRAKEEEVVVVSEDEEAEIDEDAEAGEDSDKDAGADPDADAEKKGEAGGSADKPGSKPKDASKGGPKDASKVKKT